jgi:hypothetical protein
MMSPIIIARDRARGARRGASPAIAVASSAPAPTVAGFHRMLGRPHHVDPAPEPDAVAATRVLEKTNEADGAGAATSQTIMRSDRHRLGKRRPIAIEQGEVEKIVRRRDAAVHIQADVIRPVETADAKVHAVRDVDPMGQLVVQRLAVAEKTALFDQSRRVLGLGRPVIQPTGRSLAIAAVLAALICARSTSSGACRQSIQRNRCETISWPASLKACAVSRLRSDVFATARPLTLTPACATTRSGRSGIR